MIATVDSVTMIPGSTIATGEATLEDGRRCQFAGDWRPMRDIHEALQVLDVVHVDLEDWQITRWLPQPVSALPVSIDDVARWANDGGRVS